MKVKLDDFDFGFTSVAEDELPAAKALDGEKAKSQKLYDAIIPLLANLKKDADKSPYIHWPNRVEKIDAFIEKLDSILAE